MPFAFRQLRDSGDNRLNCIFMIPQTRQDRNHVVSHVFTGEQILAVQLADVHHPVADENVRTSQFARHGQRRFAYVKYHLAWKLTRQPFGPQHILRHPQSDPAIVVTLEFEVVKVPGYILPQQIHAQILSLGQFDVQPLGDRDSREQLDRPRRGLPEQELERCIVVLHLVLLWLLRNTCGVLTASL